MEWRFNLKKGKPLNFLDRFLIYLNIIYPLKHIFYLEIKIVNFNHPSFVLYHDIVIQGTKYKKK